MIAGTIALIMILLMGGAGPLSGVMPRDFQKRLEQVIADPARSERAVAEWKGLQKDFEGFGKQLESLGKNLERADDVRGAGAAQLEPILGGFDPTRKAAQDRTIDRLLAIRKDMTREEWRAALGGPEGTGTK